MPSPFPGMDPYLEGEMWQEFHETFAGVIRAQIMPQVRPKYVALLAKRYVVDRPSLGIVQPSERHVYPDVHVVKPPSRPSAPMPTYGGVAVMEPTVEVPSPMIEEVPVLSIEIRDVAERRLVTLIEILSPVNKRGEGAREYAQRRLELMQTTTHLLELDLLCQGRRIQLLQELPAAPYYIYLSRAQRRPYTQVWALPLQNPPPTIPVPLLPPDPDVPLDLQAALDACFALVGYEDLLDYQTKPPAGLNEKEKTWVVETLQKQGLRRPLNGNA
ncbi:MAG: DUF4058 family protein [Caldilineaceae bacterium]